MPTDKNMYMVWLDCEMTGLYVERDFIIEIATIVTDDQLNVVAEGPSLVIHQSDEVLAGMDDWNTTQHGKSGLTARVKASTMTMAQAEQLTLDFLKKHVPSNTMPMCGNSIGQDRRFLQAQMPQLEAFFSYRNIDVSTIKELAKRWAPSIYQQVKKKSAHLALDDILESIAELRWYRQEMFKKDLS